MSRVRIPLLAPLQLSAASSHRSENRGTACRLSPLIAALILAGGNASRLGGGDKPLLLLGTTTLLDLLLAALRPQASALAISANGDPSRFARFGLPVLPDASAHAGPLAGVATGLAWAASLGADALLTVPGDTPFIPKNLASRLGQPPAWAVSGNAIHPLIALWPTRPPPDSKPGSPAAPTAASRISAPRSACAP